MSVKIIHFADAHIDMVSGGKQDPETNLPIRVGDFLHSLDVITDTAIEKKADLVLFAGDAYRNAIPSPTYQREWGKRMKRLSEARIPVLMIGGNHDNPPSKNRACALEPIDTYKVPYLHLAKDVHLWTPAELNGVQIQVLTVPWFSRSFISSKIQPENAESPSPSDVELDFKLVEEFEGRIFKQLKRADSELPVVLMAHYAVTDCRYSTGQTPSLGSELILPRNLVCNPEFSYTALGHIHLHQDLNQGAQPPVIYPGSIEHVNYGEAHEAKGFIMAEVENHHAKYRFVELPTRPMFNLTVNAKSAETLQQDLLDALREAETVEGAMVSLTVIYRREWESNIDEAELRKHMSKAFEFRLNRRPQQENRIRLSANGGISSQTPEELLRLYCQTISLQDSEIDELIPLAAKIFSGRME